MSRIKLITEPADIGPERQGEIDAIHRTRMKRLLATAHWIHWRMNRHV
jgi:hypothetical protein